MGNESKKQKKEGLFQRATTVFDLPTYALSGVPHIELVGNKELRMENHRGILAYGTYEIHISGGSYIVKVQGNNLNLRTMTGVELLITGDISGISLE